MLDTIGETLTVLTGNGSGGFATGTPLALAAGSNPVSVAVADFNADGKADLAIANFGTNNLTVLLSNGNGTFTAAASPATGTNPNAVAVGDFNGDGIPDLSVPTLATIQSPFSPAAVLEPSPRRPLRRQAAIPTLWPRASSMQTASPRRPSSTSETTPSASMPLR